MGQNRHQTGPFCEMRRPLWFLVYFERLKLGVHEGTGGLTHRFTKGFFREDVVSF